MIFDPHIRQLFQLRGRPSIYTAPGDDPVNCQAIRQGGGQRVMLGFLKVTPERICFHVRREDVPAPVQGASLDWDGETFTIDAVQPVERDADGLMWELDASWGLDVILRSGTGSGANQSPPVGADFSVAAGASAGDSAVSIKSTFTVGKLLAGDKFTIAGNATEYTVTGPGVVAAANVFTAVPIAPVLAANAGLGAGVTFEFARDFTVRAAVAAYQAKEIAGTVQIGDRRLIIPQSSLDGAGLTDAPKASDRITFENQPYNVISTTAIYQAGEPYAWDLQLRRA